MLIIKIERESVIMNELSCMMMMILMDDGDNGGKSIRNPPVC